MRALALALVVVAGLFAGCTDGGQPPASIEQPSELPFGLLLTYAIDRGDEAMEATFVVAPTASVRGYDLLPERVPVAGFESPFVRLNTQLNPRDPNWTGLVQYPLTDGKTYEAVAGGADVTVVVEALPERAYAWGTTGGMDLVATDAGGAEVARLHVLQDPPVLGLVEVAAPDGTEERWELQRWDLDPLWGDVPLWRIGQWWSYDAQTLEAESDLTLIYNANDTGAGGSPLYVLNAQRVSQRLTALPFHTLRMQDLASQSGLFNNLISVQYSWPLSDGATWRGSTHVGDRDLAYQATASLVRDLELPDGTYTTGYEIEAHIVPDGPTFAHWDLVPNVGYFTHIEVRHPADDSVRLNWTLTDFGDGFSGQFEVPERRLLLNASLTPGPVTLERTFEVPSAATSIETRGTAVRRADADPNSTFRVADPDGAVVMERNASHFAPSQVVSLVESFPAQAGTWTFHADTTTGTSFFLEIIGHWGREVRVDYSHLGTDRR